MEAEVWRHGRERGAAAKADGRREPPSEVAGGIAEPARQGSEGSDKKKRVELAGLREDVAFVHAVQGLSERTACKLLDLERGSYRYEPRPDRNVELRSELLALAGQKPRYGYRRLHALLVRKGQDHPVTTYRRIDLR